MRALIKINMNIHLQDDEPRSLDTFKADVDQGNEMGNEYMRRRYLAEPLMIQVAGNREVKDRPDAESLQAAIQHAIKLGLHGLNVSLIGGSDPTLALPTPPIGDREFILEAAEKAHNPELRPSFQAKIENVTCPTCGPQRVKIVDEDKQCSRCGRVVIPKPQPAPHGSNGVPKNGAHQ